MGGGRTRAFCPKIRRPEGRPVGAATEAVLLLVSACAAAPDPRSTDPQLSVGPAVGWPTERLGAHIVLPSTTIRSGSSVDGYVVVENHTGHPLETTGCLTLFTVALGNDRISPRIGWLDCLERFTIPSGESRYPVRVVARYLSCPPPPCTDGRPAPLPPGTYRAMLFRDTPLPITAEPIEVRVNP
jgi:hypothetical protein